MANLNETKSQIAQKMGKTVEEIDVISANLMKEVEERHKGKADLDDRKERVLIQYFRTILKDRMEITFSSILDSGVQYRNKKRIEDIQNDCKDELTKQKYIESEKIKIENGIIIPCDDRVTFKNGDSNPSYGMPLTISKFRILNVKYFINSGKKEDGQKTDVEYMNGIINLGEKTAGYQIIPGKTYSSIFKKNSFRSTDKCISFDCIEGVPINEATEKITVDIEKEYADRILEMTDIDNALQAVKNGEENLFVIKGDVVENNTMGEKPSIRIQNQASIDDDPIILYVKMTKEIAESFNAPIYTSVTIIGQIWKVGEENPFTGMTAQLIISEDEDTIVDSVTVEDFETKQAKTPEPEVKQNVFGMETKEEPKLEHPLKTGEAKW